VKRADFQKLVQRAIEEELANPTPLHEVEAFEKEWGLKPLGEDPKDFLWDLAALFIALQPTRAEKKRGAVD
jgi:hypothetical protein